MHYRADYTNQNRASAEVGDAIRFHHDLYGEVFAVVVKVTRFAHAPGANSITAYAKECGALRGPNVMGLPSFGYEIADRAKDAQDAADKAEACRVHYREHLTRYPVWAARFESGNMAVGF